MHWPPKHEDRAAWSAVGGVVTLVMAGAAFVSPLWPVFAALALVGFYFTLAPLLHIWPWHQREEPLPSTAITAGHDITAGGDIDADGIIAAGHSVQAGGHIRSSIQDDSLLLVAAKQRKASLVRLGIVNSLSNKVLIRQYAAPLEHDEPGCVIRVAIAGDSEPPDREMRSDTKEALKNALARSDLEKWGSAHASGQQANPVDKWIQATPNSGRIATFKRDWGILGGTGSVLAAKATLQLPLGLMLGPRILLVLDVIERNADPSTDSPRLDLSLSSLHKLLHTLSRSVIDELATAVFPLIYNDGAPSIVGPNYEIQFGDRALDNFVQIPASFTRPDEAQSSPWATIDTPEDSDARDLAARDAVLRRGLESVLRSNEYDGIEDEVAKLPVLSS